MEPIEKGRLSCSVSDGNMLQVASYKLFTYYNTRYSSSSTVVVHTSEISGELVPTNNRGSHYIDEEKRAQ